MALEYGKKEDKLKMLLIKRECFRRSRLINAPSGSTATIKF